jgi:hypothetical protein
MKPSDCPFKISDLVKIKEAHKAWLLRCNCRECKARVNMVGSVAEVKTIETSAYLSSEGKFHTIDSCMVKVESDSFNYWIDPEDLEFAE